MIKSIRKENPSAIVLDCGAVFNNQKDNDELQLKAMQKMGYDALNIGIPEIQSGKAFLQNTRSHAFFPYIASNLLYDGARLPWALEYMIREVGGVKAAILGILDPDDLKKIPLKDDVKGFEIIPPEEALGRLLPEVRGKADLVILLSQLDETKNRQLLEAVRGIDVSISSGCGAPLFVKSSEKPVKLYTGSGGVSIGLLTITLDDKGTPSVGKKRRILLDTSVADDAEILGLVETYKKEQAIKEEKMKKKLVEGLQLTPQEFMERYQKEQGEQKKGEAR